MKINLDDVTNIDSITTINANFDKIVEEFQDKVLYRDSPTGEPNTVESNIDMNGFDIINVKDVYSTSGRWATINEMLALNSQTLTYKNQAQQYSLDSLQYKNDISDIAIDVQGYQLNAEFIYDQFSTQFLGTRNSDPTTDNKGGTLLAGAMYFRTTAPALMRIYNGSTWQDVGSIATTTTNTIDPTLFATQLEAEQGTNDTKVVTPAKVKDAINSQVNEGFTSTGPIVLPGDASSALQAIPKQQLDAIISIICPPGKLGEFATHPSITIDGWARCNGQELDRTTDAALYEALGGASSPWGQGDGTTTFNVPDYRGRTLRDLDESAGRDPGRVWGSYQDDQNKAHNHTTGVEALGAAYGGGLYNGGRTYPAGSILNYIDVNTSTSGGSEVRVKNGTTRIFIKR